MRNFCRIPIYPNLSKVSPKLRQTNFLAQNTHKSSLSTLFVPKIHHKFFHTCFTKMSQKCSQNFLPDNEVEICWCKLITLEPSFSSYPTFSPLRLHLPSVPLSFYRLSSSSCSILLILTNPVPAPPASPPCPHHHLYSGTLRGLKEPSWLMLLA